MIALVLTDSPELRLDPTLIVRSGPDHVVLKSRIAAMRRVLGMVGDETQRPAEPDCSDG